METEVPPEMKMEGGSGNLMVMAQQSRLCARCSDRKNPSEESVTVGRDKSARDKEVVISSETGESATESEEALKKEEAEEGALLNSTGGVSSMRKEAEEASGKAKAMEAKDKRKGKGKVKAKVKDEESGKAEVSVTEEAGRPEESVTEAVTVGSSKSADEVMGKETLQQLLKGTPNRFAMLDPDGDDEKDEMIDRGKSAIEEEHMPSYGMNPSDRGEESVAVGSGKSAKANEEAGKAEASVTEAGKAEEAVAEAVAEAGKAVADMNSVDGDYFIREEAQNELGKRLEMMGLGRMLCAEDYYYPKGVHRALLNIKEKFAKKNLRQLVKDLSDKFDISMRSTSAIEEHMTMVESDKLLIEAADPSATDSMTRLGQWSVQDDLDHERAKSATPLAKKTADEEMAYEAKNFDLYCRYWESAWSQTCGTFEYMTALSSMQFTYYTPGRAPPNIAASTPATLQILSVKLAEVAGGLQWPLPVYGVVAVRDVVDHNRNFLFSCERDNSQELTQNDPFLRLIGPSRAVVYTDIVNFEIQLKVKGTTVSQDKALITEARDYDKAFGDVSTVCFKNCLCMIELSLQVVNVTTQATILGVQVARGGSSPFEYGARVTCSPKPGKWGFTDNPASGEIVMVDSKDGAMLKGSDGYLHLPRTVISVESQGRLDVEIQAYSKSGEIAGQDNVSFMPKLSKLTRKKCFVSGIMVVITVAWSLVAVDKHDVMALGCMV